MQPWAMRPLLKRAPCRGDGTGLKTSVPEGTEHPRVVGATPQSVARQLMSCYSGFSRSEPRTRRNFAGGPSTAGKSGLHVRDCDIGRKEGAETLRKLKAALPRDTIGSLLARGAAGQPV
jgi:hypothetical protein